MRHIIAVLISLMFGVAVHAQIGYQVTLLDTATGEPRSNETVNVRITITDSAGGVVCSETKSATTNDFGILSVAVGSQDTFAGADWSKLPFFIEATVDGVMIGRSQLLTVPVAEHANHIGVLTKEKLKSKKWVQQGDNGASGTLTFGDSTCAIFYPGGGLMAPYTQREHYFISGNMVGVHNYGVLLYDPEKNVLLNDGMLFK